MREILTRFGRHNIGMLWLFVEPMIFTLGVTTLWTLTKMSHSSSLNIVTFAVTGYSSVLLWRNMPGRCIGAVSINQSLMYHRNVKIIDIYLARSIIESVGALISFVLISSTFSFIGWMDPPENLIKILFAWLMLSWFGISLAFLLGALSEKYELIDRLWHPASYLLFPLSGAAFMVDILPPAAQNIVLALPMVHGVEMLRDGYFGSTFNAHYDVGYMTICCLLLTLFGLAQIKDISGRFIPE
jgi:ABC-type polysaccharide/polyol phosphate export permease